MKSFNIEIEGITPYMQHRMDDVSLDEWEKQRGRIIENDGVNHADATRAEYHAFMNSDGKLFMPSEHIRQCLINGGAMVKSKVGNARKSMKNIVAGMFYIREPELPITQKYAIDKRSAVNQNNKARVITIRPRWDKWSTNFILDIDNDTITEETIRQIIEYAGSYVGVGSYRPQKNGMYGRFKLKSIKQTGV